ncbi:MAG TPA: hypothetical protein VGR50_07380 [Terriglobales bacterium]|nr:hypothetical protein [Terriglobales bacterium]
MAKPRRKRILITDPVLLSEDEGDYLVGRERERTETAISFEEFLKNHPKDVERFLKRRGRMPGQHVGTWASE